MFIVLYSIYSKIFQAHQMVRRLQDIVQIATGFYGKATLSGDTFYLQAKHFDEAGDFRPDAPLRPELDMGTKLQKHKLRDNDILLTAKGDHNKACFYRSDIGQAVACSTFFVLRPTDAKVMPRYLHWYLNTAYAQRQLSGLAKGTRIRSISKKLLLELEVQVPPQGVQSQILEVQKLWDRERALTMDLLGAKETLYQYMLLNLAASNAKT